MCLFLRAPVPLLEPLWNLTVHFLITILYFKKVTRYMIPLRYRSPNSHTIHPSIFTS